MSDWSPRTFEDKLLAAYHDAVGGRMYTEVAIAWSRGYMDWPAGHSHRSIDAVRLVEPYFEEDIIPFANHGPEVLNSVEEADVELIEVKQDLNRNVIGQVVAGRDLFSADYEPASIKGIALCANTDSALEWVCEQENIIVEIYEPVELE